jgi:energy-coupling factor transporter ATP-binding protein EcfA2
MQLKRLSFSQFTGQNKEWCLENLSLAKVNLLVGKNASGKTRSLAVVNSLANMLSGDSYSIISNGSYKAEFGDESDEITYYEIDIKDGRVANEKLTVPDKGEVLSRHVGGVGKIFLAEKGGFLDFQTPDTQLAAVARRDSIQHPFFEPLNKWGDSLRYYLFGSPLGKHSYGFVPKEDVKAGVWNDKDMNHVLGTFMKGTADYKEKFKEAIIKDMRKIDYKLEDISVRPYSSVGFPITPYNLPSSTTEELYVLSVKEASLTGWTEQVEMSQGMFRALSIIIQVNYSEMASRSNTILIDDIGEGLDFERSCDLIELLMEKVEVSKTQLTMSTNDRFVMNYVPLEAWSVLQREGQKCRILNYRNSKEIFDDFQYTGLSNFDFFAKEFYRQPIEVVVDEPK